MGRIPVRLRFLAASLIAAILLSVATVPGESGTRQGFLAQTAGVPAPIPNLALCFDFKPWLELDNDALADRAGTMVRSFPKDPETCMMLMMYREAVEESSNPDAVGEAVRDVLDAHGGDAGKALGRNARVLLEHLHEVSVRRGWWDRALAAQHAWAGLQAWLVAGPFGTWVEGDLTDVPLPPDSLCSLTHPMSGTLGEVKWRTWVPETPLDIEVAPSELSSAGGNGWYMLTQVSNPGPERDVLLDVYSTSGGMKVWLNGAMVMRRLHVRDLSRDDSVLVRLPKGVSTLLLKHGRESSATVRMCDPATRLTIPEIQASVPTPETMPAFVTGGEVEPLRERWSFAFQPLARRLAVLKDDTDERGMLGAALALVAADNRAAELAEDCWKLSERWRKADPVRDAVLTTMYFDRSTVHSPEAEMRGRRGALEALVKVSEASVRPRLELAKVLGEENQDAEAARLFREAIEARPAWPVYLAAAEFYHGKGWEAERRDLRLRAFADAKPTPPLMRDHAEFLEEQGDEPGAVALLDNMLKVWPGSNTGVWRRFSAALRRGEFSLAESLIGVEVRRVGGESVNVRASRVRLAVAQGRWQEAARILAELAAMPHRAAKTFAAQRADLLHRYASGAVALEAWRSVLESSPSDPAALQAVASLSGRPAVRLPEEASPVSHGMLETVSAADFPKAGHAVVLHEEVWEINADGGGSVYGQRLVKVLRQESVDRVGRDWVPGEVLRARTMLPDGTSAEPASVTGSSFEFPKVAPGAGIDTAWVRTLNPGEPGMFGGHSFPLRERSPEIPTLHARLVVLLPPGVSHSARLVRAGAFDVATGSMTLPDGRVRLTWELKQPTSWVYETAMPSMDELIPAVEFAAMPDVRSVATAARAAIARLPDPQVTWRVREQAHAVIPPDQLWHLSGGITDTDSAAGEGDMREFPVPELLYQWINTTIKGSGAGYHPHSTLEEKAGDRQDLFIAMLDSLGIPYRDVRVGGSTGISAVDSGGEPSLHRRLVKVPTALRRVTDQHGSAWSPAEWTLVDFAWRMAPFGALGRSIQGVRGIEIWPARLAWRPFEAASGDGLKHGADLRLQIAVPAGEDDDAVITGRLEQHGDAAWQPRETAGETSEARHRQGLEAYLSDSLDGLTLDSMQMPEGEAVPGDRSAFWQSFTGTVSGLVQAEGAGLRLKVPLEPVAVQFAGVTSLPQRRFDLLLTRTTSDTAEVTLVPPKGMAWASVPRDFSVAEGPVSMKLSYSMSGRDLVVSREYSVRPWRVPAGQYAAFRNLIERIDRAESAALSLVAVE